MVECYNCGVFATVTQNVVITKAVTLTLLTVLALQLVHKHTEHLLLHAYHILDPKFMLPQLFE